MLEIKGRILDLKDRFGITDLKRGGKLARKLGIHNSVITRLIDQKSFPTIENIITICQNAGVSANYLLFGEESPPILQEIIPKSDKARPLASKDFELLNDSIIKVEEELNEEKKTITSGQKFRLILRVYNDCVEFQKEPDRDMVKRYLSVMD